MKISRNGDTIPKGINGGGEGFTSFLEKELISYIEKTYPTTTHKTIIGRSLGGLLVINTLIHHPELFNNYITIGSSLWWNDQKIIKRNQKNLNTFRSLKIDSPLKIMIEVNLSLPVLILETY